MQIRLVLFVAIYIRLYRKSDQEFRTLTITSGVRYFFLYNNNK